ncbi:plasmid recombination protein [Bacillus paranthracis]
MSEKEKEQNSHIDYSRSDENKYLVQKDLKELYREEFGEVLENYNAKQKRNDRKIDDYYKHIQSSKKTCTSARNDYSSWRLKMISFPVNKILKRQTKF